MKNKAFTLIELLVVVLIIGILAAIAVPQYQKAVLKTKYERAKATVSEIIKAYELYYLQYGTYPTKFSQLDFANKFSNSNAITSSGDYVCSFNTTYNEVYCQIDSKKGLFYMVNFYTYYATKITKHCRTNYVDENDITRKLCKEETGKNGTCIGSSYCDYLYD